LVSLKAIEVSEVDSVAEKNKTVANVNNKKNIVFMIWIEITDR
jgi:hypothetical protein